MAVRGSIEHELGRGLRVLEEHELRVRHRQADFGRVAAVVDHFEHLEPVRLDAGDGAPQQSVDAFVASQGDHAVWVVGCHVSTVRRRAGCSNPLSRSRRRDQSRGTTLASSCRDLMSSFRYTLRRW